MWARQLLSKIEKPMERFSHIKYLMNNKECKKIIKTYNRVPILSISCQIGNHSGLGSQSVSGI